MEVPSARGRFRPREGVRRTEGLACAWGRPEHLGRRAGTCRVSFYPENERTASGRQPADKGGGPDSNRVRAALTAVCERLQAPFSGPSFMALELVLGALGGVAGEVRYPPPFGLEEA